MDLIFLVAGAIEGVSGLVCLLEPEAMFPGVTEPLGRLAARVWAASVLSFGAAVYFGWRGTMRGTVEGPHAGSLGCVEPSSHALELALGAGFLVLGAAFLGLGAGLPVLGAEFLGLGAGFLGHDVHGLLSPALGPARRSSPALPVFALVSRSPGLRARYPARSWPSSPALDPPHCLSAVQPAFWAPPHHGSPETQTTTRRARAAAGS